MKRRRINKQYKPVSPARRWAQKRNWLLLRLRGASSVFSGSTGIFLSKMYIPDAHNKVALIDKLIRQLREQIEAVDKYHSAYE